MTSPVQVVVAPDAVLRPWHAADAAQVASAGHDADIARWNPLPTTPDAARSWCAKRADWSAGDHASWALAPRDDPTTVWGSVSVFTIDRDQLDAEIGFWIAPAARGRGRAGAAVRTAAGWAFTGLGLHRIVLHHDVANTGSCRTALAAGFGHEGVHRESYRYGDGRWCDEHSHARLADD